MSKRFNMIGHTEAPKNRRHSREGAENEEISPVFVNISLERSPKGEKNRRKIPISNAQITPCAALAIKNGLKDIPRPAHIVII